MGILRKAAFSLGVATIVGAGGAGFVYRRRLKENKAVTAQDFNAMQDQPDLNYAFEKLVTPHAIDRKATVVDPEGVKLNLYRYTTCPFCGKAKAFLDYFQIDHSCIEVEPMFKGEIGESTYKKVPQLQFDIPNKSKPWLVDSDLIVETLAEKVGIGKQLTDPDIKLWRGWARESLVKHFVVNLNQTLIEAWQGYDYIDQFDTIPYANKVFLKVMGAPVMYLVSRYKTKPALIKSGELQENEDPFPVLVKHVNRFTNEALTKNGKKRDFHGGAKPDLADLDVYGVFQSIRGHKLYNSLLDETQIKPWLTRMDAACHRKE